MLPDCTIPITKEKLRQLFDALKDHDLVYLHVEASDEAGHEGNVELKTKTISYLDQRIVKFLVEETEKNGRSGNHRYFT